MSDTSVRDKQLSPSGCVTLIAWLILTSVVGDTCRWGTVARVFFGLIGIPLGIGVFLLVLWWEQRQEERRMETLTPVIHYYRGLGFFAQYAGRTDESIRTAMLADFKQEWGNAEFPSDQGDAYVLCFDDTRVRWLSFDDHPNRCTHALKEMAEISQGLFRPVAISECAGARKGSSRVSFTLDGQRHCFEVDNPGVELLRHVNGLIDHTGCRFYSLLPDPDLCVVLLSDADAARIGKDRGPASVRC